MNPPSRRVLVTGCSRGIGLEFVRQLLERGDRVLATCRDPAQATALTALAAGAALCIEALDVTDPASRAAVLTAAEARWGALDLLINNAGVLRRGEAFGALEAGDFRAAFETNTLAPLLLTEAAAPLLARGEAPGVAYLSSTLGSIANTRGFYTISYGVAKAGLNMGARHLAEPLGALGIRSVLLHPGWVQTEMGGAGATLTPAESVRGLLAVIDSLPAEARAPFLDWRGDPLPW